MSRAQAAEMLRRRARRAGPRLNGQPTDRAMVHAPRTGRLARHAENRWDREPAAIAAAGESRAANRPESEGAGHAAFAIFRSAIPGLPALSRAAAAKQSRPVDRDRRRIFSDYARPHSARRY